MTVLYSAGQFVLFSYFAPYFKSHLGVTPLELSGFFAWFGFFGFVGNFWISRHIDHLGASRAVGIGISAMALSMAAWSLGSTLELAAFIAIS